MSDGKHQLRRSARKTAASALQQQQAEAALQQETPKQATSEGEVAAAAEVASLSGRRRAKRSTSTAQQPVSPLAGGINTRSKRRKENDVSEQKNKSAEEKTLLAPANVTRSRSKKSSTQAPATEPGREKKASARKASQETSPQKRGTKRKAQEEEDAQSASKKVKRNSTAPTTEPADPPATKGKRKTSTPAKRGTKRKAHEMAPDLPTMVVRAEDNEGSSGDEDVDVLGDKSAEEVEEKGVEETEDSDEEEVSEEVSEASETSDSEEKAQVPTRLTTRQRAMLDRRNQNDQPQELVALPMEKKREITEEEKTRKAEQALRRRRQQQKQAEEEKAAIVKKLLARTATKEDKPIPPKARREVVGPAVRYVSNEKGFMYSFPEANAMPLQAQPSTNTIGGNACVMCHGPRRYLSKQLLPLCSLECYRACSKQRAEGKSCE